MNLWGVFWEQIFVDHLILKISQELVFANGIISKELIFVGTYFLRMAKISFFFSFFLIKRYEIRQLQQKKNIN